MRSSGGQDTYSVGAPPAIIRRCGHSFPCLNQGCRANGRYIFSSTKPEEKNGCVTKHDYSSPVLSRKSLATASPYRSRKKSKMARDSDCGRYPLFDMFRSPVSCRRTSDRFSHRRTVMTNTSHTLSHSQVGSDTAPLRAKWG